MGELLNLIGLLKDLETRLDPARFIGWAEGRSRTST
jgi:hypothetical protein